MTAAAPDPFAPSPVDLLVSAYRAADERCARVEGRWPLVRLVVWPVAALVVVLAALDVHGPLAWVAVASAAFGLAVAGVHVEQLHRAAIRVADAWGDLAEYTNLPDDALVRLVEDDSEFLDDTIEMEAVR